MSDFTPAPWAWQYIVKPLKVVDGDTFDARVLLGLEAQLERIRFRLVGPGGEWFDAAESRGARASQAGVEAATMLRVQLARALTEPDIYVGVLTFKPDPRDSFGRWLAFPSVHVQKTSSGFVVVEVLDIIGTLVRAGVAELGGRFHAEA